MIFIIVCLLAFLPSTAQQQVYQYHVLYKGERIGNMYVTQVQAGDELKMKITSHIKMRMLMPVKVTVAEESSYKADKLMYSAIYREVNGKQKANRQTTYCGNCYQLTAEGKKSTLQQTGINCNLVRLYSKEPVNITQVYADNFQQFFQIKSTGPHTYRLELPDGNYNIYYYQNGICVKAEVHNTFFTIQMQLAI